MRTVLTIVGLVGVAFAAGAYVGPRFVTGRGPHVVRRVSDYPADATATGDAEADRASGGGSRVAPGSVHALGRIEPAGGLYPVGAPAGLRVEQILVEAGQQVDQGQDLARVQGYIEKQAQVALIEAQLAEAREQLKSEEEYQVILDQEAKLEKDSMAVLEEPEVRTLEANIDVLAEKAKGSKTDYTHLVELNRDKRATVSSQEIERQHLIMRQDEASLRSARAELQKYKTTRGTRLARLDLELKKSKAASTRTRHAIPVRSLEQQLVLAREQVSEAVIRAPRAGRILAILVKPGETPGPKPVLQLGDTRRMYVVAEVDEDQIPLIKKGQKATIQNRAWNRSHTGIVESWALMVAKNDVLGLDPAAAAYARVVEITIKIDEPCDDLRDRTHMQVNVDIDLGNTLGSKAGQDPPK
jgi:HlyD family secretion protein